MEKIHEIEKRIVAAQKAGNKEQVASLTALKKEILNGKKEEKK